MKKSIHNQNYSKEKIDLNAIKKVFLYCKPYLPAIIIALLLAIFSAVTSIIGPDIISNLMQVITDGVVNIDGINFDEFINVIITLICLYVSGAIASYIQQFLMADVTQKTAKKLRSDINRKINKLPLKFFDTTTRGNILSIVTNDVDTISQTLGSTISNLVNAVTLFVGVLVMMFIVNWLLAIVTIVSTIIGFLLMFLILSKSQKYFNMRQQKLGELNGHIEEIYTNHNVVKSYNAVNNAKNNFDSINNSLYSNNWKSQALSGIMHPLMGFAGNLSYAAIFIVGVSLILGGSTTIGFGTIISFTIYARLFSQPLTTFAQSMNAIQQTSAASKRVFNMLESEELSNEEAKTIKLENIEGNIEFKNVKFGYGEDLVIKDFSASIKKGQKVAIVGPTGAGKTTIVNLLMRFYEVQEGDILIDGVSIKDITRENVHDIFDMILQDTWLFNGTLRDNLCFNKKGVTDEELDKVCEAVGISHYISTLKDGYDTVISNGLGLSEGQKQQLTIARAMIKDSPLLILDEATSNVDTRTEIVIQNAMDNLTNDRTSFVIAHRLSTIKNADLIIVLKEGDIVEHGTHDELLSQNGFYAELYNSQFADVV